MHYALERVPGPRREHQPLSEQPLDVRGGAGILQASPLEGRGANRVPEAHEAAAHSEAPQGQAGGGRRRGVNG
eukprot:7516764-Pyramimonas_sp.AAC.1